MTRGTPEKLRLRHARAGSKYRGSGWTKGSSRKGRQRYILPLWEPCSTGGVIPNKRATRFGCDFPHARASRFRGRKKSSLPRATSRLAPKNLFGFARAAASTAKLRAAHFLSKTS